MFQSTPHTTPPPGTGTVACISLDIRYVCIKLSQIFTVTHVLKYGEAKFVVSKKKGNCEQKFGFGSDPPPPIFSVFFLSDSTPHHSTKHQVI